MTDRKTGSSKLLWLLLLVPLAGGIAFGVGRSQMRDASVGGTEQEITMGALSLAVSVGLIVFALVLGLYHVVANPGARRGAAGARGVALVMCVVLIVIGVVMATMLYPQFLDMVAVP